MPPCICHMRCGLKKCVTALRITVTLMTFDKQSNTCRTPVESESDRSCTPHNHRLDEKVLKWRHICRRKRFVRSTSRQRRRSVVKPGVRRQSGQTIGLFRITCYVDDFQTFKNSFTFRSDAGLSSLTTWYLKCYPTTVLNERT